MQRALALCQSVAVIPLLEQEWLHANARGAVDHADRAPYLAQTSDRNRVAGMVAAGMPEIVARCGDRRSVVKTASFV
jgi:hypothetical protein